MVLLFLYHHYNQFGPWKSAIMMLDCQARGLTGVCQLIDICSLVQWVKSFCLWNDIGWHCICSMKKSCNMTYVCHLILPLAFILPQSKIMLLSWSMYNQVMTCTGVAQFSHMDLCIHIKKVLAPRATSIVTPTTTL